MVHLDHRVPVLFNSEADGESGQALPAEVLAAAKHDPGRDRRGETKEVPAKIQRTSVWARGQPRLSLESRPSKLARLLDPRRSCVVASDAARRARVRSPRPSSHLQEANDAVEEHWRVFCVHLRGSHPILEHHAQARDVRTNPADRLLRLRPQPAQVRDPRSCLWRPEHPLLGDLVHHHAESHAEDEGVGQKE